MSAPGSKAAPREPASREVFSVAGGVAGHQAMTEDLHTALAAITAAADHLSEATTYTSRTLSHVRDAGHALAVDPLSSTTQWRAARAEDALASIVAGPYGTRRAEDTLLDIGDRLKATVAAMEEAENAAHRGISVGQHMLEGGKDALVLVADMTRWGLTTAWAVGGPSFMMRAAGHDPVLEAVAPGAPKTTGLLNRDTLEAGPDINSELYRAITALGAAWAGLTEWRLGEHSLVRMRERTEKPSTLSAPHSIADVVRGVYETEQLGDGALTIQQVEGENGAAYIVSIPGTQDWSLWLKNYIDGQGNLEVAAGLVSDLMGAVYSAMSAAGIPPDAAVMLAGHSQGGLVAMSLATMPEFKQRFNVTHVVTTGAPVAHFTPGPEVTTLHLEHAEDIVPGVDFKANHNGANQTTFSHAISQSPNPALRDLGQTVIGAHSLDGYAATAELAESGVSSSVDAFVASAAPFLGTEATVTTRAYDPAYRVELPGPLRWL